MKLLQKTIRSYFIYSVIILLVAIPGFYVVVQQIVREDMDEELVGTREMIIQGIAGHLLKHPLSQLKTVDPDITITPVTFHRESDSLSNTEIYETTSGELVPHRVLSSTRVIRGQPVRITIVTSLVDSDNLILSIVLLATVLLLSLLGGLLVINHYLTKKIWQPFYTTLGRLQNYKLSDAEPLLLDDSTVDEFNDLKQSLLQLTNRSQQAYQGQKEFTENASHEMQTPLAILQAKLELLMQTSPLNEDQALLIGEMADASQRMARLGKSLLLLTKIENKQFPVNEQIELDPVIRKLIQQYELQARQKKITLHYSFKSETVVDANKILIEVLITNLLSNAIRHNCAQGTIQITLERDKLTIQNTGVSSRLNDQKIFNRFQKESTDANSLGLGLEIAKKICELYYFRINYSMTGNLHSFQVIFA